jgi:hypothetical protein
MKIFVVNHKSTTYLLIQLVLWLNFLFYTAMTLSVIFMCSPIRKFWNPTLPGHCVNSFAIIVVSAVFNVVSNIATVFLPVRAIWQLQMPMKRKLGVSSVFMAGLLYAIQCYSVILGNGTDSGQCLFRQYNAPLPNCQRRAQPRRDL